MKRAQVEKFINELVVIQFDCSWFNEAVGEWVDEDIPYVGCLRHCEGEGQQNMYVLDHTDDHFLPTDECCFGPTHISKIQIVKDEVA